MPLEILFLSLCFVFLGFLVNISEELRVGTNETGDGKGGISRLRLDLNRMVLFGMSGA